MEIYFSLKIKSGSGSTQGLVRQYHGHQGPRLLLSSCYTILDVHPLKMVAQTPAIIATFQLAGKRKGRRKPLLLRTLSRSCNVTSVYISLVEI